MSAKTYEVNFKDLRRMMDETRFEGFTAVLDCHDDRLIIMADSKKHNVSVNIKTHIIMLIDHLKQVTGEHEDKIIDDIIDGVKNVRLQSRALI